MLHTNTTRGWGIAIGMISILFLMGASLVYGYTNTTWH